jgi:hypothetical protein
MKAARLAPPIFDRIPRWLLERLTAAMLASEDKQAAAGDATTRRLAPTLHYDFELVMRSQGALDRFAAITADVLLLSGTKSPAYLVASVDALERVVPRAQRVRLSGLDHSASGNSTDPLTGRGADPGRVAQELRRFFA